MEPTDYLSRDRYGMYSKSPDDRGPGPRLMGADTLLGNDVYNTAGEDLGDIKEIMLDMQSGRVAYAVLAFGGFLGMGAKLFAVPWRALVLDTANHRFTLDVSQERLQDVPGFDSDRWPDMADETWAREVHGFYRTPYVGAGGDSDDAAIVAAGDARTRTTPASPAYDRSEPNDRIATNRTGMTPDSIPVD